MCKASECKMNFSKRLANTEPHARPSQGKRTATRQQHVVADSSSTVRACHRLT
jgi:hypothetical protein